VIQARKPLPSVVTCPPVKGEQSGSQHPAMFPVAFATAYIAACTGRGDIVVDSFGGSGTTLIAAEMLGRRAFVMELHPSYCDLARVRYERFTSRVRKTDMRADDEARLRPPGLAGS